MQGLKITSVALTLALLVATPSQALMCGTPLDWTDAQLAGMTLSKSDLIQQHAAYAYHGLPQASAQTRKNIAIGTLTPIDPKFNEAFQQVKSASDHFPDGIGKIEVGHVSISYWFPKALRFEGMILSHQNQWEAHSLDLSYDYHCHEFCDFYPVIGGEPEVFLIRDLDLSYPAVDSTGICPLSTRHTKTPAYQKALQTCAQNGGCEDWLELDWP